MFQIIQYTNMKDTVAILLQLGQSKDNANKQKDRSELNKARESKTHHA